METVRSRICESCLRYHQTPLWGHTLCSAHRICCRDDKVWKPGDCDTCLEQQDKLDLASNKVREASFREMSKMLIRTKSSKGFNGAKDWQYEDEMGKIVRLYHVSPNSPNRLGGCTPASEIRLITDNQTPMSHHTPLLQNDATLGSKARESVRSALDEQTIENIDESLQIERDDRRYTLNRTVNNPRFRLVQQERQSRKDKFENSRLINVNQSPPTQNQNEASASTGVKRIKRPRYEPIDVEYHQVNRQYIPENIASYSNGNQNEAYFSDAERDQEFEDQCMDDIYYIDDEYVENQNNGQITNQDTDYYSILQELGPKDFEFDRRDHLPWFRFRPGVHERISQRKITVPTKTGPLEIEVTINPNNPLQFRPKANTKQTKDVPLMDGAAQSDLILKMFDHITTSEINSENKAITLLDAEIKPESRMNSLLGLVREHVEKSTRATFDGNKKQALHCFPNSTFQVNTLINFNQGWTLNGGEGTYGEWVKDKQLSVDDLVQKLWLGGKKITVPEEKLNKEREARKLIAVMLSAIYCSESSSDKVEKISTRVKMQYNLSAEENISTARFLTPVLKKLINDWMDAKMAIRTAVISNTNLEAVVWLLNSNLLTPGIFPKEAIEFIQNGGIRNHTKRLLGLDAPNNTNNRNSSAPPPKRGKYNDYSQGDQFVRYQQYGNQPQYNKGQNQNNRGQNQRGRNQTQRNGQRSQSLNDGNKSQYTDSKDTKGFVKSSNESENNTQWRNNNRATRNRNSRARGRGGQQRR